MLFLVDEEEFMPHLQDFYEKGAEEAKKNPVWFVQYLLIVALAKALLGASRGPNSPPGCDFFERAMALMPEFVGLHRSVNLAMQVLCLVGLYLVSVDMKDAAFSYVRSPRSVVERGCLEGRAHKLSGLDRPVYKNVHSRRYTPRAPSGSIWDKVRQSMSQHLVDCIHPGSPALRHGRSTHLDPGY